MLIEKKMTLVELFQNHSGLPTEKFNHHLEAYGHFFSPFQGQDIGVLEIGIRDGGSLQLWRKYFGPAARIYGLDIQDRTYLKDKVGAEIFVGDQGDIKVLRELISGMGQLHIVIDDGSHNSQDQIVSFKEIFPTLEDGGLYIVEDIHTSYRENYGGGLLDQRSFVEYLKARIDFIHRSEFLFDSEYKGATHLFAIHIYPSLAIIEKRDPRTYGSALMNGSL